MYLLGIPEGVDPVPSRPTAVGRRAPVALGLSRKWLSARSMPGSTAKACPTTPSGGKIAADNGESARRLAEPGITEPQHFADPDKLTRQEMIEMIVAGYAGFEPDLEVVYPGAEDPTVLTVEQARAMPEAKLRERAAEIVGNTLMYYDRSELARWLP